MPPICYDTISYETDDTVAVISLNRPDVMNAINAKMREELMSALNRADGDSAIRVKILTGVGKAFCVGHDLKDTTNTRSSIEAILEEEYRPVILAIDTSPKLTIAAVNGVAAGAGASIVLACDLILMASDAYLYQAFAAIGLIPDCGATWYLLNQLGYRRAMEVVVSGEKLTGLQCLDLGLANKVVDVGSLRLKSLECAKILAEKAPLALSHSKAALKYAHSHSLAETISYEAKVQNQLGASKDASEGTLAFLEKRKPNFMGN
jgi:2-(1,2-epoxy-1,2-dihydrophenyl)acetyl-CoA isomerase